MAYNATGSPYLDTKIQETFYGREDAFNHLIFSLMRYPASSMVQKKLGIGLWSFPDAADPVE